MHGGDEKRIGLKSEGKRAVGRPNRGWGYNINMHFMEKV